MNAQRQNFNCSHCLWGRHCDKTNPAKYPIWIIREIGFESNICPLPMITPFSNELVRLYWHYKNHLLPFTGGILDQPNIYTEAMSLIDATFARIRSEKDG